MIINPADIPKFDFDKVVICLNDYTNREAYSAVDSIINQLHLIGINDDKIEMHNIYYDKDDSRIVFLKEYSESVKKLNLQGAVAECGVMRGHFAHYISKYFDTYKFYMFDTFSGFDERDIECEKRSENEGNLRNSNRYLVGGNEEIALRRCPNKQNVIVKKGFIPDTFSGLEEERFVFVNLDMDLYAPTLSALKWFSGKMVKGGLILCHDYFAPKFPGIRDAVDEFSLEADFIRIPTGESMAIMMQK